MIKAKYPVSSLIPNDTSYKVFVKKYENAVAASGLGKGHGLRHGYAQNRYEELTGFKCSVHGGLQRKDMNTEQKEIDLSYKSLQFH
ncbi:hypothetical protein [Candidatus Enterovibrio escicola]|uniref:hypothetical protein n=1 Tax=Candidatus Enterovibrio escicola TaxID=1927127 RepID=UPI001237F14A|nr:hypothetical protein [Candidatus Enterovibrio escacola]